MKKRTWWTIGTATVVTVAVMGSGVAYAAHYADRALPRTVIAGHSIAGMTAPEIATVVEDLYANATVTVNVDGSDERFQLDDVGVKLDVPATVELALSPGDGLVSRFTQAFDSKEIKPVVVENEAAQVQFLETLSSKYGNPVKDAHVSLNSEGTRFEVAEAQSGIDVDPAPVLAAVSTASATLQPQSVSVVIEEVEPAVTTEKARSIAEEANGYIDREVSITDGIDLHVPDAMEKAGWVVLGPDSVSFDEAKVRSWVDKVAKESNVEPQPGIRNVNSRGDVVSTVEAGKSGWKANNASGVADELVASLTAKQDFHGDFDYDEIAVTEWNDRLIADGAENLAYKAAPKEKWIDVNLTDYTVSAYEGSTIVRGPIPMVPGAPQTPTLEGTFAIYHRMETQTMRGTNADGSKYETPDVPWISYYDGNYALHGAYWRTQFGHGGPAGSHGCINMPVEEAKWIFDWSGIGTVVTVHY